MLGVDKKKSLSMNLYVENYNVNNKNVSRDDDNDD